MILRFEAVHDFAPITSGEIELRRVSLFEFFLSFVLISQMLFLFILFAACFISIFIRELLNE